VLAKQYEAALLQGDEVLRPGLVRLNLHYCLPAHVVEYLLKAVSFVAAHGWKLLPLYTFIPDTGEWRHRSERKFALRHRRWLSDVRFDAGAMHMRPTHTDAKSMDAASAAGGPGAGVLGAAVESFGGGDLGLLSEETGARYLEEAMAQVAKVAGAIRSGKPYGAGLWTEKQVAAEAMALRSPEAARLRWFMYPSEAIAALKGKAEVGWGSEDGCEDGGKASQPCVPQGWQAVNGAWCSEEGAGSGQEQKGAVRQQAYAVSGFERFALQQQTALLQRQPHATFQDVLQVAGEAWRSLSGAQREAYAVAQDGEGLHANEGRTRSPIPTPAGPPPAPSVTAGSMQEEDARGSKHEGGSACDDREAACESGCAGQPGSEQAGGGEGRSAVGSEAGVGGGRGRKAKGGRKAGAGGGEATETVMVCPLKPKGQGVCEDPAARKKRGDKTQKKIMNLVGKAIMDFGMIRDGDRVLVGLSGGKDSLTLLHILLALQRKAPIRFDIGACTVDPQTPEYDPSVLKVYLKELGVPYFYQSHGIIEQASCSLQKNSLCSFCSRMKRGILYSTCKREGYGVLALGQHLDDQAESLLMSCFHNGQLRTMKAHYMALEHSVRVIRPLNYCREYLMRDFAHARALPVSSEARKPYPEIRNVNV
jgi:tRNA 2-thiocytidine biosynthesis protein TtcA